MALGPRLDLRQSQSLVMTPQLQQAIRLLALSNLEIEELHRRGTGQEPTARQRRRRRGGAFRSRRRERPRANARARDDRRAARTRPAEGDAPLDVDLNSENIHQDSAVDRMGGSTAGSGSTASPPAAAGEAPDFDSFASEGVSLHEYLLAQAGACLPAPIS
jgi:RNA polymerase sigma-54 factor